MAAAGNSGDFAGAGTFNTTHWSVVLAAGRNESPESTAALEKLCQTYWYPLYTFVRRQGQSHEDAQDLTQDFFARLLGKNYVANADMERGKFRTFLLGSLKNFMVNEWKRAGRLKRGGAHAFVSFDAESASQRYAAEPMTQERPESLFERSCSRLLIPPSMRSRIPCLNTNAGGISIPSKEDLDGRSS
jgi:DNA-directed RNA polymerase specialized sigma24 family protein